MNNERIVNSIKSLCKSHNITITKLEETLGLSQGLISRWNKSDPSLSKLIDIADYFNTSLDEVVGRCSIVNDKFIEKLILKTNSGEIKWNPYKTKDGTTVNTPKQYSEHVRIKIENASSEEDDDHDEREISYYTCINNNHYISLYGTYNNYRGIKNPINIKLFIQPGDNSELFEQPYSNEQLLLLWLKVLFALNEQAPDEIRIEEFKNSLVFEDRTNSNYNIPNVRLFIDNPSAIDILKIINSDEFIKLQQMFTNPEFQTAIKAINSIQNHFNQKED